jgi:hypothetical protein
MQQYLECQLLVMSILNKGNLINYWSHLMIIQNSTLFIVLIGGIVMHSTSSLNLAKAWLRDYNNNK